MKTKLLILITLLLCCKHTIHSQIISTIAGNGTVGYTGNGGPAINALLNQPNQMAFDLAGNLFIAEDRNHIVRKINPAGVISLVAGTGVMGFSGDGGLATNAQFNRVCGVAVDGAGNVYICDTDNNRIRKVNTSGVISTIAGTGVSGHTGDGGLATLANIGFASGIQLDAAGNIYIACQSNSFSVRKITIAGIITTVAGNGTSGYSGDGGLATSAQLNSVSSLFLDGTGNMYVSDFTGFRIRKVNASGIISTFAGNGSFGSGGDGGLATSAQVFYPYGIVKDAAGNVYFCEAGNNKIRKIDLAGIITTFAGTGGFTGGYGGDGGLAVNAQFNNPSAISIDASGNFFIGDYANHAIRKITATSTGLNDQLTGNSSLGIYPNPNNGVFTLSFKNIGNYIIVNSIGQTVKTIQIKNEKEVVEMNDLSEGIYYVSGKQTNGKIIITK